MTAMESRATSGARSSPRRWTCRLPKPRQSTRASAASRRLSARGRRPRERLGKGAHKRRNGAKIARSCTTETEMHMTSWITRAGIALFAAIAAVATVPGHAQTLRFGLAEDPDVLDPTLARTFVGRVVFAALCDKLFDVDEKLNIVPQLATSYEWSADRKALTLKLRRGVTFHDGEKFDAAAVKFKIQRPKNIAGSNRPRGLAPRHRVAARGEYPARLQR